MIALEDARERLGEVRAGKGKESMEIGSSQIEMGRTYKQAIAC